MNSSVLLNAVEPEATAKLSSVSTGPRALHEVSPVPSTYQADTHSLAQAQRPLSGAGDIDQFIRNMSLDEVVLIPAGAIIKGEISTDGRLSVIIAGRVEGTVDAGKCTVIVKDGAEVIGTIRSENIIVVAGTVTASAAEEMAIITSGLWVLAETGKVNGSCAYGRFKAYEGGTFAGRAIPHSDYSEKG